MKWKPAGHGLDWCPALALAPLALCTAVACASSRPWKVDEGEERRFTESRKACELLTDDAARFDACMRRRGWRREYPGGF